MLGVVYELSCLEHLKAVPPSVTHISFSLLVKLDSHLSQNREQLKELRLEKVSVMFQVCRL